MKDMYVMLLLAASVLFVSGCVGGPPTGRMMHPGDEDMADVAEIFKSAGGLGEITSYCSDKLFLCGYYCRTIEPENDFCSQLDFRMDRRFFNESKS